jgi:hypothetical protein
MHVQYVALCDQVIMGADGRPTLVAVFNHLQVPTMPFVLPRLAVAARLMFTADETNRSHRVEVVMTDPSGSELGRPGGEINLPAPPAGIDSVAVDLPLQFDLFNMPLAGLYSFVLHVDGKAVAGVQLAVHHVTVA